MRTKTLILALVFLLGIGSFCHKLLDPGSVMVKAAGISGMVPCESTLCFDSPSLSVCCSSDRDSAVTLQGFAGTPHAAKKLVTLQSFGPESRIFDSAISSAPVDFSVPPPSFPLIGTVIKRE